MSTRAVDPTETAVSLQDSYKDVTEWYASRTTVNDASSFRVLAVSLLVLVSNNHHVDPAYWLTCRSSTTALGLLGVLRLYQVQSERERLRTRLNIKPYWIR